MICASEAPGARVGDYLYRYDPEGCSGRGCVSWTPYKAKAMRFADVQAAIDRWRTQSTVQPLRPDGKPNRPLTAYTVTFEGVE